MNKIGFNIGENGAYNLEETLRDISHVNPKAILVLPGALPLAAMLPGRFCIFRPMAEMRGFELRGLYMDCYNSGKSMAHLLWGRYGAIKGIDAIAPLNEIKARSETRVKQWAYWSAGFADGLAEVGSLWTHVDGNWAMGEWDTALCPSGNPWMETFALTFLEARIRGQFENVIWGYHCYTDGAGDSYWLEQRPETLWRPALKSVGIAMPRWGATEAFYDEGARTGSPQPGYKHHIGSDGLVRHIAGLPALLPSAEFILGFQYKGTDDWLQRGFCYEGDQTVLDGMAMASDPDPDGIPDENGNGGNGVTVDEMAQAIWDKALKIRDHPFPPGYVPQTAIGAFCSRHPDYGLPLTGEWPTPESAFQAVTTAMGIVISEIGPWRTGGAKTIPELVALLKGLGYPK